METFGLYLLKSVIWLCGFALVYILFLRNERFFRLNRLFLLSGILISFFFYVFVNPSISDRETKEIVNHELAHIRQRHWFDLVLAELLCIMQWFNPVIWIYIRFVRQNHEYMADEVALQRTSDPAIYKATLLNQIVGAPVVSLANSLNYSLNKKRFNMMKNIISSPYRKMKILLILPVFALVLYAFANQG